jgi:hypothetical protein
VARGREVLGSPVVTGSSPAVLGSPVVLGSLAVTGGPVVLGRPVRPGGPAVMGNPVMTGAGMRSGALGAAQAETGRQTGHPQSGRPGRAKPGAAKGPGRTVEQQAGAGRGLGCSGAGMAAGRAVAALESVHLPRGVPAMAERVARALERRAAAAPGRQAVAGLRRRTAHRAQTGRGGSPVPGATIGTHGGHPAGSG